MEYLPGTCDPHLPWKLSFFEKGVGKKFFLLDPFFFWTQYFANKFLYVQFLSKKNKIKFVCQIPMANIYLPNIDVNNA